MPVYKVKHILPGDCKSGVQSVYKVSELTSRELSAWVEPFQNAFRTYLQGTVDRECSLNVFVQHLHPGDCLLGVHPVLQFSNLPPGTVCLGYRLFIRFRTFFQGTVIVGCNPFIRFLNQPLGICLPRWSLFIRIPTVGWVCILFFSFQTFLKGTFDKVKNQLQGSKSGVQTVYLGF